MVLKKKKLKSLSKSANLSWLALNSFPFSQGSLLYLSSRNFIKAYVQKLRNDTGSVSTKFKLVRKCGQHLNLCTITAVTQLHLPLSNSSILASRVGVSPETAFTATNT
jgi:hypothetical protein